MSADNGLVAVRKADGWELREYCASVDQTFEEMIPRGTFATAEELLAASRFISTEYGIRFFDEGESA